MHTCRHHDPVAVLEVTKLNCFSAGDWQAFCFSLLWAKPFKPDGFLLMAGRAQNHPRNQSVCITLCPWGSQLFLNRRCFQVYLVLMLRLLDRTARSVVIHATPLCWCTSNLFVWSCLLHPQTHTEVLALCNGWSVSNCSSYLHGKHMKLTLILFNLCKSSDKTSPPWY